jgi:hypothetical protein
MRAWARKEASMTSTGVSITPTTRLAIIMPAYNEAGNIAQAVRDVIVAMPGADVIVISDGSTDAAR